MRFRYLRDPLFVGCVVAYFANRLVVKRLVAGGFFHDHFNDLICIAFWVPIMLFVERKLGLRGDDRPPRSYEIIIPLIVWSAFFELLLPQAPRFARIAVSDYTDVLFYTIGALMAALFWRWWYGGRGGEQRD